MPDSLSLKTGISIILPNYNGRHLLEKNLPSIISSIEKSKLNHEIIISDDNSTDDSIEFINHNYPQIRIITQNPNTGFSSTCNRGIRRTTFHLTCIVNTDVTFDINYFENALPYFKDTNLFAIKGKIINYDKNYNDVISIDETCKTYFKRGLIRFNCNIKPDNNQISPQVGGQYVGLGCCFIANTQYLKSLHGYNEIFSPYYWEDSDLALRALESGYTVKYVPECLVYHQSSSTISQTQTNIKRKLISNRNKYIFSWLHMSGAQQWLKHICFMSLNMLTRWIIIDWKFYVSFYMALIRIRKSSIKY